SLGPRARRDPPRPRPSVPTARGARRAATSARTAPWRAGARRARARPPSRRSCVHALTKTLRSVTFWRHMSNGTVSVEIVGDGTTLNAGDAVSFEYTRYDDAAHAGTPLAIKHESRARR